MKRSTPIRRRFLVTLVFTCLLAATWFFAQGEYSHHIKPALAVSICGAYNKVSGFECGGGTQPVSPLGSCRGIVNVAFDTKCNYGNSPQVHPLHPNPGCPDSVIQECPNDIFCPCVVSKTECGTIKHCSCLPLTCEQICAGDAWVWDNVGKGCACASGGGICIGGDGGPPPPPGPPPPVPPPPGPPPPVPPPPPPGEQCTPATEGFCAPDQIAQCTAGTPWQGQETNASTVCKGESGGNPYVVNDSCLCGTVKTGCTPTGDYSVGLFQYNLYAHCNGAFENLGAQCRVINRSALEQCVRDLGYSNFTLSADGILDLTGATVNMCQYISRAIGIYTGAGNSWCPWSVARSCGIAQSC